MIASDTMVCVLREYVEGITLDALRQKQELTEEEVAAVAAFLQPSNRFREPLIE